MNGPEKIKWWHLREKKTQLSAALATIANDPDESVEAQWNGLINQIRTAAAEALGKTKPGRRFINKEVWWWTSEVQDATKAKKATFQQWRKSRAASDWQEYRRLKSSAKRAVAAAKSAYHADLYEKLKTPEGANRIYQLANSRHRASQDIDQVTNIRGANHQMLQDPTAIRRRWRDYFDKISNDEFQHPPIPSTDPVLRPVAPITPAEVSNALEKMKNGKATGLDDVPAEAWKLLGRRGAEILASLFNAITKKGAAPAMWTTSITVPIWKKKGDVNDCKNYRPIRLLCHAMKIFERVIDARLRAIVKISTNQCGFVKGAGTTDAIHAARLLIERHREKNQKIHIAFLDLEKAFDRVPHDLIWTSLRSHGVPEEYVRWIKILYANKTSAVRCPAGTSEPFPITVGVHQGSALSPLLFILCMDTVSADLQTPHPWTLLYADDVLIASETRQELERLVDKWNSRLDRHGLRLNTDKTEYMETGQQTHGTISVNGQQLKKVTEFKYLGSILRSDGDSYPDARAHVNAAWTKWRQVTGVLCDRRMPTTIKGKIYKTVVRPVAMYGSECWAATTRHEQALHAMEMKMLRWPLGLTRLDHVMNVDVRRRMGVAPITTKMREARLRWFGHVVRSAEGTVANTAYHLSPPGRRPRGRPKKRWMDCMKEDMRALQLTPEDAQDRVKWKKACQTADPATARDESSASPRDTR
uniref:Reverse transcriptase domain-containing protein n=1 Tax=Plectus sambesii TaxID=2011161 RepID=A0A914WD71_9BILA